MLYSSVHNLIALIGRKAYFTHSLYFSSFPILLPLLSYCSPIISPFSMLHSSVYNLFALIGRKAPFSLSLLIYFSYMYNISSAQYVC